MEKRVGIQQQITQFKHGLFLIWNKNELTCDPTRLKKKLIHGQFTCLFWVLQCTTQIQLTNKLKEEWLGHYSHLNKAISKKF